MRSKWLLPLAMLVSFVITNIAYSATHVANACFIGWYHPKTPKCLQKIKDR